MQYLKSTFFKNESKPFYYDILILLTIFLIDFIKFIFGGIYITDFLVTLLIFIPIVLLITNNQ